VKQKFRGEVKSDKVDIFLFRCTNKI